MRTNILVAELLLQFLIVYNCQKTWNKFLKSTPDATHDFKHDFKQTLTSSI